MDHWSGPARALSVHLDEWEHAQREQRWMREHADRTVTTDRLPRRLHRWYAFAQTYAWPEQANADNVDGASFSREWPDNPDPQRRALAATSFAHREWDALNLGGTFYVSAPIAEEVTAIAEQAEPEPLFPTDLIAPQGFAVLERPVLVPDLHPDTGIPHDELLLPVRAFAWTLHDVDRHPIVNPTTGAKGAGVTLLWYTDCGSYNDVFLPASEIVLGRPFAPAPGPRTALWPIEVNPWGFGIPWGISDDPDVWRTSPTMSATGTGFQRRWFMAFMRLLWQTYLVVEPYRPRRPELRRIKHSAFPMDGYVRVLRMRRAEYAHPPTPDGSSEVPEGYRQHLRYRTRTRGHWRRVHVKSLGPARLPDGRMDPATHRLRWISDYYRGPEDGPVVEGYDVTAAVR